MTPTSSHADRLRLVATACGTAEGAVELGATIAEQTFDGLQALVGSCDGAPIRVLVLGDVAVVSSRLPGTLGHLLQAEPPETDPLRLARAIAWICGPEARGLLHDGPTRESAAIVGPEEIAEADVVALARTMGVFPDASLTRHLDGTVELRFLTRWSAEVGGAGVARVVLRSPPDGTLTASVDALRRSATNAFPSDLAAFVQVAADRSPTLMARRVTYIFRWGDAGGAAVPAWLPRLARGKRRLVERASGATRAIADKLDRRGDDPTPVRHESPSGASAVRWWLALTPRLESGEFSGQELWLVTLTVDGPNTRLEAVPSPLP